MIDPVEFNKLDRVQPYLEELRSLSAARLATNQDYAYIQQGIAEYEKQNENQTATINEHDAIKEREHVAAENEAHEDELQSRPLPARAKNVWFDCRKCRHRGLPALLSYYTTNTVTAGSRNTPVMYYSSDRNFIGFSGQRAKNRILLLKVMNVVATWTKISGIKLSMNMPPSKNLASLGMCVF